MGTIEYATFRYDTVEVENGLYTEPEPEPGAGATRNLCKLINYLINYCFQSPQETLVIVFSGGWHILKNTYHKVKMRRLN